MSVTWKCTSDTPLETLDSRNFYREFHGHKVSHLKKVLPALRSSSDAIIWLAGDSSLDNKYWFSTSRPAVGAYKEVLRPPSSKCDVSYWLNSLALERRRQNQPSEGHHCEDSSVKFSAINAAVEATTLNRRTFSFTEQDRLIQDNIAAEDVLIVSIGGNDIALLPSPCTITAITGLVLCTPKSCIEAGFTCYSVPFDDCCCGCGPSLISCAGGCPPQLGYFRHMFGTRIESYVQHLTKKTRPKLILVCMIYYPDEAQVPGWAGPTLAALGYDDNPQKLQLIIRKVFQEAIWSVY
jgi:hypothetical protein